MLLHAFLLTLHFSTALGNKLRLVKMRDPYGVHTYRGDWSAASPLWNEPLYKEVVNRIHHDYDKPETLAAGEFYMAYEAFLRIFTEAVEVRLFGDEVTK
jgi:hypothetical protein